MSWVAAVKEWNAGRESWSLPKKGTSEYEQVRKIQDRIKESAPAPAPKKAKESEEKAPRRSRKVVESEDTDRPKRAPAKPKDDKPPTEPTKPNDSKTRVSEPPSAGKRAENKVVIMDMDEYRRLTAPAPVKKDEGEPLKAKTKEDRAAARESKKQAKLELIETRSQLAKAKLEKNKDAIVGLSQKVKDLKISLL
jgi:hypothetical protein